jgi:hypothetical protein
MPPDASIDRKVACFAADFASALLDPSGATPADIAGPGGKAADRRYDVYRNNVTVSLIDALAALYPAVQRIVGTDFFRGMARLHVRTAPPTSPLLFEYGRDFPAFIERFEYTQDIPWLADVARLERVWLDAYHAADLLPLSADTLAGVAPERLGDLVFTPHPAARIVRSAYPAVTIFAANRVDGPTTAVRSDAAEDALITRPAMDVVVRVLPAGGAVFLAELIAGKSLDAAASAASAHAAFDLPGNIAAMIEAGVFSSIYFGD